MVKVAELAAEVKLNGAKEAAKGVENLTRGFGFLGSAASGALKILEWGANTLKEGVEMSHAYARQMDIMAFRNKIGAESFQKLDQAFKQHNGRVEDFISVYENLQNRQARWRYNQPSQMEATAFAKLGINYNDYLNDTVGLMDAITYKLLELRKTNVGEANMWADILGFNSEFLRVAEKGNYTIYDNLLSNEQIDKLNKQTENWNNINNAVDQLKIKLGAKWSADWGMNISSALLRITNELNDAANSADGFWASLWNIGKKATESTAKELKKSSIGSVLMNIAKGDFSSIGMDFALNSLFEGIKRQGTPTTALENLNGNQSDVYKMVEAELRAGGLSGYGVYGALGNIMQESTFNPNAKNGSHYGLVQWDRNRQAALRRFANGADISDPRVQARFLMQEIRERGLLSRLNNARSAEEAATIFEQGIEVSGRYVNGIYTDVQDLDKRIGYANHYAGHINQPDAFNRLSEQAAISNSSKNITVNTDAKVYISANNVDTNLTTGATAGVLKEGINIAAQDYTEDNNG